MVEFKDHITDLKYDVQVQHHHLHQIMKLNSEMKLVS